MHLLKCARTWPDEFHRVEVRVDQACRKRAPVPEFTHLTVFLFFVFFSHSASSRSFLGDYFKIQVAHGGGKKKSHGKEKKNNKHVTEFSLCAKFCARILHQSSLLILKTFLKVGTTFPTEMEQGRLL